MRAPAPRSQYPAGKRLSSRRPRRKWLGVGAFFVCVPGVLAAFGPWHHRGWGELMGVQAASARPVKKHAVAAFHSRVTPDRMARLSRVLEEMARHAPARSAAVCVEDTETGLSAAAHPDQPFLAASLIKVPVMAAAFACWQRHPERRTPWALGSLEQMITVSDNASTDRLIDLVGGPERVTHLCAEHGWQHLQVRHAILNHRGRHGTNQCTAREMTEMLVALDRRQLLGRKADEQMWKVLCRQKKRHRIPAGLPHVPGLVVGNKTGTLGNVLHDAGIVHTPRVRYAITILLAGQRSDAAGERFCREVSREVFDALYGAPETQVVARRE